MEVELPRRLNGRSQYVLAIVIVAVLGFVGVSLKDTDGSVRAQPGAALYVEVSGVPDYIYIGTKVKASLDYSNFSPSDSGPVLLETDIPANFAVLDASHGGIVSNTKVQWPLESIAGKSSGSVTLTLEALRPTDQSTASYDVADYSGHAVFDDGFKLWARISAEGTSGLLASGVAYADTGVALGSLALSPSSINRETGVEHCLTATASNGTGDGGAQAFVPLEVTPAANVTVTFTVRVWPSGPVVGTPADVVTNSNGQAEFCYISNLPREDEIEASATIEDAERKAYAYVNWFAPGTMTLRGIVYYKNNVGVQLGLAGARVEACDSLNVCKSVISAAASTVPLRSAGEYEILGLHTGNYTITVFPPELPDINLNSKRVDTIINPGINPLNIQLPDPIPVPSEVTIEPYFTTPWIDAPVVFWFSEMFFAVDGCPGGTAGFTITIDGDSTPSYADSLNETTPGHYEVDAPFILFPLHGLAIVEFEIECPDLSVETYDFLMYIDPSGVVQDTEDNLIEGATVTLYRSTSELIAGPYAIVTDVTVMSPANRTNPDTTDEVGHFGWDVIAGFYKVRATAENCHAPGQPSIPYVETAALTIPPPVTDLVLILECEEPEIPNGSLKLNKAVVPANDDGKFNLQVNGSNFGTGANVGNGGTSGKLGLAPGNYTVRETAGNSTTLANYVSAISCVRAGTNQVVASADGTGPLTVNVPPGVDVVCNFTNALIPQACRGMTFDKLILGTEGNDTLTGTGQRELLVGLGGNDTLNGGAGNDCIVGGPGNDTVGGGSGNDKLFGDAGIDTLNGDSGTDVTDGGADRDKCIAESKSSCES